jgi:hypothetical protein
MAAGTCIFASSSVNSVDPVYSQNVWQVERSDGQVHSSQLPVFAGQQVVCLVSPSRQKHASEDEAADVEEASDRMRDEKVLDAVESEAWPAESARSKSMERSIMVMKIYSGVSDVNADGNDARVEVDEHAKM